MTCLSEREKTKTRERKRENATFYPLNMKNPGSRSYREVVARLVAPSRTETAARFIAALKEYASCVTGRARRDAEILREMMSELTGESRRAFAITVIRENVLGHGLIHAAARLDFFSVSPLILYEFVFNPVDGRDFSTVSRMFSQEQVMCVLKKALRYHDDAATVIAEI